MKRRVVVSLLLCLIFLSNNSHSKYGFIYRFYDGRAIQFFSKDARNLFDIIRYSERSNRTTVIHPTLVRFVFPDGINSSANIITLINDFVEIYRFFNSAFLNSIQFSSFYEGVYSQFPSYTISADQDLDIRNLRLTDSTEQSQPLIGTQRYMLPVEETANCGLLGEGASYFTGQQIHSLIEQSSGLSQEHP